MNVATDSRVSLNRDRLRTGVRDVLVVGAAAAIAAVVTLPAAAQEAGAKQQEPRAALEEIVVTAQKREQSLQEVPVSVSAFSANAIEMRSSQSLVDLAAATPNLSFNTSVNGQNVRIRGVGAGDTLTFFDPGVGIYVDGLYLPRMTGLNLDLVGIDRVEVLRGPQGTLFGRNTIGGAISIITRRPGDKLEGSAQILTGSRNRIDGNFHIEGPIGGTLNGSLDAMTRNQDGYGKRLDFNTKQEVGETNNLNRWMMRGSLVWEPTESLEVMLKGSYSDAREKGDLIHLEKTFQTSLVTLSNVYTTPDYNDQFLTADPYTNYVTGPQVNGIEGPFENNENKSIALFINWNLGRTTFHSITAYFDQTMRRGWDIDGSPLNMFTADVNEKVYFFSQEFQLNGLSFDDRLNWVAGLYYSREYSPYWSDALVMQTLYDAIKLDASQKAEIWDDNSNWAAFGQGTYKFNDKLSMTAGARYSYDDKWSARKRSRVNPPQTNYLPYEERSDTWSAWTGRLGFEYKWTDEVMTYISASRGYKSGGFNAASTSSVSFQPYDPEYLTAYELGLRSDWLDRRLRFNASLFASKYKDMQFRIFRTDSAGTIFQIVDNVAESEINGLEVELAAVPVEGLELTAGIGYLDAKYTYAEPGSPITVDDKFIDTPKWSLMASAQYAYPLQNGARLTGRVDYQWYDDQQRLYHNSPYAVQSAYSTVNARLALTSASGKWEAAVYGTNLTDEHVMGWAFDISTTMNIFSEYKPPREWGASLKYNF